MGEKSNKITVKTTGQDTKLSVDNIASILKDDPITINTANYIFI